MNLRFRPRTTLSAPRMTSNFPPYGSPCRLPGVLRLRPRLFSDDRGRLPRHETKLPSRRLAYPPLRSWSASSSARRFPKGSGFLPVLPMVSWYCPSPPTCSTKPPTSLLPSPNSPSRGTIPRNRMAVDRRTCLVPDRIVGFSNTLSDSATPGTQNPIPAFAIAKILKSSPGLHIVVLPGKPTPCGSSTGNSPSGASPGHRLQPDKCCT